MLLRTFTSTQLVDGHPAVEQTLNFLFGSLPNEQGGAQTIVMIEWLVIWKNRGQARFPLDWTLSEKPIASDVDLIPHVLTAISLLNRADARDVGRHMTDTEGGMLLSPYPVDLIRKGMGELKHSLDRFIMGDYAKNEQAAK